MLYIVPTPIGNLEDITLRAIATLRGADIVLAEDTRRTKTLLSHLGIDKPVFRYNENDPSSLKKCLHALQQGKNAALVSDGGTPAISDPGWRLAAAAVKNNIQVTALPGPCAAVCALSAAGISGGGFIFLGFMPRKPGKIKKQISEAYALKKPVIIYESPYRIIKLLDIISETTGPATQIILAREISKVYEEYLRGTPGELKENLEQRKKIQGEFVVIIAQKEEEEDEEQDI